MNSISDKTFEVIKEQKIAPAPKWKFLLKSYLIWLSASISMIIGSLSFAVIIFRLVNNDWEILEFINRGFWAHLAESLPYLWLGILIAFIFLAYYNVRHTKGAYRHQAYWLVIISIIVSLGLGGILYGFGLAPDLHYYLNHNFPFIQNLTHDREEFLTQSEVGLLAGTVKEELTGEALYLIEDFHGVDWMVKQGKDFVKPNFQIKVGDMIRLTGQIESNKINIFVADQILPYHLGPGEYRRP